MPPKKSVLSASLLPSDETPVPLYEPPWQGDSAKSRRPPEFDPDADYMSLDEQSNTANYQFASQQRSSPAPSAWQMASGTESLEACMLTLNGSDGEEGRLYKKKGPKFGLNTFGGLREELKRDEWRKRVFSRAPEDNLSHAAVYAMGQYIDTVFSKSVESADKTDVIQWGKELLEDRVDKTYAGSRQPTNKPVDQAVIDSVRSVLSHRKSGRPYLEWVRSASNAQNDSQSDGTSNENRGEEQDRRDVDVDMH